MRKSPYKRRPDPSIDQAIQHLGSQALTRMVSELFDEEDEFEDEVELLEPLPADLHLFKIATSTQPPLIVNAMSWFAALGNALAHFGYPPIELMTSEHLEGGGILVRDVTHRQEFLIWPYASFPEEDLIEVETKDLIEIGIEELEILEALGEPIGELIDDRLLSH